MIRDDFNYVVVIDIGHTYTSCCFAIVDDNKPDILTIKNWPRQPITESVLPTIIGYSNFNPYQTVVGIGNLPISPNTVQISDLPLLLTNHHPFNKSGHIDEPTSIRIFADYLRAIHAHVIKRLSIKYKSVEKIRFCLTKISNNPIYQENLMKAAELAGIASQFDHNNIVFADAYLSVAKYMSITRTDLELFDTFIICDTDSSYIKVKSMKIISAGRDIDVEEIKNNDIPVEAYTQDLTDNEIDARFSKYMLSVLQKHPDFQGAQEKELQTIHSAAIDYFVKNVKYSVDFNSKKEIFLRVPSLLTASKSLCYIQLQLEDLKAKVYDAVLDHVCKQISTVHSKIMSLNYNTPHFVFLCGKMSKAVSLRQQVQSQLKSSQLVVLSEEQLSAAKGAIYYGLNKELKIKRLAPMYSVPSAPIHQIENKSYYDFTYDMYSYIIGIDFGTSFSKWYYLPTKEPKEPDFNPSLMITPTLSLYDERLQNQKVWGIEAFNDYYEKGEPGQLLNRFKLSLEEMDSHNYDDKMAIRVIAIYLASLHEHICSKINADRNTFRYCLTVPTIWSDKIKDTMRKAALQAHIISESDHPARLILVNEPEAAAMYYARESMFANLDKNKRALIVDAGGGTVDMATYEYFKKPNDTSISINEVTPSTGGLCGSSFLEDNFKALLKKKCYEKNFIVSKYDLEASVKHFTFHIKAQFSNSSDDKIPIEITKSEKTTFRKMQINIDKKEMQEKVFDPVVKKVIDLLELQIKQSGNNRIDLIILSGGLGQSRYLKEKIEKLSSVKKRIKVFQPESYDSSIVRGACLIAKNPNVITQRILRKSYGIEVMQPYNSETDTILNQESIGNTVYSKFKFDKFIDMYQSVKTYEYYEKTYQVEYPNNTYVALYSTAEKNLPINSTLHPDIREVFRYLIDTPAMDHKNKGDMISLQVRLYLGQTEIKVDTIFDNTILTRHSFHHYTKDKSQLEKTEALYHNYPPRQSSPPGIKRSYADSSELPHPPTARRDNVVKSFFNKLMK